ncbi:MAG: hypothetical protein U9N30_04735, partial [Campylobacterota bacterium]|nr:hypothetical protein [Campylobacterota bacterium]
MIEQRIEQIKAKLVMEQPYFGSIASTLSVQQNDDLQTFQTKPALFEYNDEYIETLNDNQIAFTLTASAMHHALSYDERKENRMDWLWTLAQDYAINALLISNNLDAPPKINHDTRFDNMSSERIYKILESEIDEDKHTPQKVEKFKTQKEFQDQQLDDQTKDIHQQQLNKAKLHGDLPLGIEIVIPNIHEGEISWRDELHEMIEHSVKFDYSMFPPNKRYLWQGVALPSLSGNQL